MGSRLVDWLFGVIASPVKTLEEIARERPVGSALLVALGVSILTLLANFYSGEGVRGFEEIGREFGIFIDPSIFVFGGIAVVVVMLFITTGLLHLLAKLFRGEGGYWNLFSAYCFAEFPMIISVPVIVLGAFAGIAGNILSGLVAFGLTIWVIVLQVIAVRESHGLSTGAGIVVYSIHFVVLIVIPVAVVLGLVAAVLIAV